VSPKKHKSREREPERERYYLFPGQGGRSYHEKQKRLIFWATVVALVFGAIMGAIMYWLSRMKPL
jgi:hypothetical protein